MLPTTVDKHNQFLFKYNSVCGMDRTTHIQTKETRSNFIAILQTKGKAVFDIRATRIVQQWWKRCKQMRRG